MAEFSDIWDQTVSCPIWSVRSSDRTPGTCVNVSISRQALQTVLIICLALFKRVWKLEDVIPATA